jgi:hypothetical protein
MCVCVHANSKLERASEGKQHLQSRDGVLWEEALRIGSARRVLITSPAASQGRGLRQRGAMYEHLRVVPPGKRLRVPSCTRPEILGSG